MKEYNNIVLTKTWLTDDYLSSECFEDIFNMYRKDLPVKPSDESKEGGVPIACVFSVF